MSAAARNRRVAEELVGAFVALGLRDVILSPGSRHTPLVLAFEARPELTVHSVLDERAGAFIALGASRARGTAALVCCTSGSAPAHFLPALVEATYSQVPLIALTGDRPRALQAVGAPQTIDQAHLFGRHARWFFDLAAVGELGTSEGGWIGTIAARAWGVAHGAARGPVHLNVPFDEPLWEPGLDARASAGASPVILAGAARLADRQLAGLIERLRAARRGLILCGPVDPAALGGVGQEALRAHRAALAQLATRLGWPLVADALSQLRFSEAPCAALIGSGDAISRSPELRRALEPDVVLRLGRTPTSRGLLEWLGGPASGAHAIVVDGSGSWDDPLHGGKTIVVADPQSLCRDLADALPVDDPPTVSDRWLEAWCGAERTAGEILREECASGLWEGAVARAVVAALPAGALLHVASSMPVRDLDAFGGTRARDLVVASNRGANGIDGLLATAAGEALAAGPERTTALLAGDLAFLHDLGGLAAAAQLPLRLTVVLVDNGGGGIFEFLPIARHPTAFERRFLTPQRARPRELCEALGAAYWRVTSSSGLADTLGAALAHGGLAVVHVPIDRALNVARHREVFERTGRALAAGAAARAFAC